MGTRPLCNFVGVVNMFGMGPLELACVATVVLLLFGNRLPSCAKALGEGIKNFKKGLSDD